MIAIFLLIAKDN